MMKKERVMPRFSLFRRRTLALCWLLLALSVNSQPKSKCPKSCFCHMYYHTEDGPSLYVECKNGGMHGLPVEDLDRKAHQLYVAPPLNKPNFITIGPILTQPVPFSNLRDLTIANSNVPSIGQYSFWGLHNLRTLNLTRNNISSVNADNFRGLINLSALYLDFNQIEQMPSETFGHLTSLKRLSVANNQITTLVPRLFRMLAKLEILNLSFNPLKELSPEMFKDVQRLVTLKCRRCLLRWINAQIFHLAPHIEELDLGENLFKYLTPDEFMNLRKLKTLQLDGNQLSVIVGHVFSYNAELQTLFLGHNRIALLAPASLNNLTRLTSLDVSYNKLEKFHLQAFTSTVNSLNSINLSGNNLPMNEIAMLLQILPEAQNIGLSNLSIKDIPANLFMYNKRVTTLDVSSNQLTKFPYNALKKTKFLQLLDISHNKLESLNDMDLYRLEAIPRINLSPNMWHCDQCSVGSMLLYMKTTVLNGSLRNLRCHEPISVRGMELADLDSNSLEPCPSRYEAQLSVIAGLVLVVVAVLATAATVLCCTRRRGVHYYTNEDKRHERDPEHPEELLADSQQGGVSTINTPFQNMPDCS